MKVALVKFVTGLIVSPRLRSLKRNKAALLRQLRGAPALIHYCHQVDDPYSQLMLQVLPALAANNKTRLVVELAPEPDALSAPDLGRLQGWSRRDAAALAEVLGLEFTDPGQVPNATQIALAQQAALATLKRNLPITETLSELQRIGSTLWSGNTQALAKFDRATAAECQVRLTETAAWRKQQGHYLSGTLYFEGEWYWGVDRLYHLEQRLREQGLLAVTAAPFARLPKVALDHTPSAGQQPTLQFFCSPRSPYSYLAIPRVAKLAEHYGAKLEMRFILPAVMRAVPVTREKSLYIARDTKREAEAQNMPFGPIADPVGPATERCLAVLHRLSQAGIARQMAFFESFMRGVWAEGIDGSSDAGLIKIAERAGVSAELVLQAVTDDSWRAVAKANIGEMLERGVWGPPCFRVNCGETRWGQDRLWQVERDLIAATNATKKI